MQPTPLESAGCLQLVGLPAEPAATLLGIYESKHCHTQDLCMSIRPATLVYLQQFHNVCWSRPSGFYKKNRFLSFEPNIKLILCGSPCTALTRY